MHRDVTTIPSNTQELSIEPIPSVTRTSGIITTLSIIQNGMLRNKVPHKRFTFWGAKGKNLTLKGHKAYLMPPQGDGEYVTVAAGLYK